MNNLMILTKIMFKRNKNKIIISISVTLFLALIILGYIITHPLETLINLTGISSVNPDLTQQQFIDTVGVAAQQEYKKPGVFPSITIAQAILESTWGKDAPGNNLFGIKAYNWTGKSVTLPTKEEYNGVVVTVMANFRVYDSMEESIEDHNNFLLSNRTYSDHGVFNASNFIQQAEALQASGYATDSQYAQKLCVLIKQYGLDKYDK